MVAQLDYALGKHGRGRHSPRGDVSLPWSSFGRHFSLRAAAPFPVVVGCVEATSQLLIPVLGVATAASPASFALVLREPVDAETMALAPVLGDALAARPVKGAASACLSK